jgi:hypothetical protein
MFRDNRNTNEQDTEGDIDLEEFNWDEWLDLGGEG